jgi:hypothetical protein
MALLPVAPVADVLQVIKKLLEISMHVEPRIHQNFRM